MSPMLFNLYVENVFIEALENAIFGIKINDHSINIIRFADDTDIITYNEHDMQLLLDKIKITGKQYVLMMNASKPKFLAI